MNNIIIFCKENPVLVIALLVVLALIVTAFRVEGMLGLLGKAAGLVLQQICSLFMEAFFLAFKIINSLELYIVLLLDSLTGKSGSSEKVTSLAIGALSIASFYTTYSGMTMFMKQPLVAVLITVGIQSILLSTSLRIGSNLEFSTDKQKIYVGRGRFVPVVGGIFVAGMIAAYVITLFSIRYGIKTFWLNMIYMMEIILGLAIVFHLVSLLIHIEAKNQTVGKFLFIIYFCVLAVSSFFSYNSFVETMYPESIRTIDVFQDYKTQLIDVLDRRSGEVDSGYYGKVSALFVDTLNEYKQQMSGTALDSYMTPEEINVLNRGTEYQDYNSAVSQIAVLNQRIKTREQQFTQDKDDLFNNSRGVGHYTNDTYQKMEDQYNKDIAALNGEKQIQENVIQNSYFNNPQHISQYEKLVKEQEKFEAKKDIQPEIQKLLSLLGKNKWTESDSSEASNLVNKLEESRINLNISDISANNNLQDLLVVVESFKRFNQTSSELMKQILPCSIETSESGFEQLRKDMLEWSYKFLEDFPETSYVFWDSDGTVINTRAVSQKEIYNQLETAYRNSNLNISQTEKSVRTFLENKMIGILCALFALVIDMMILFVGVISPKGIEFFQNLDNHYSKSERDRILSNLFNKPVKR